MIPLGDATRRRIGYLLCAVAGLMGIWSSAISVSNGDASSGLENALLTTTFVVVAAVSVRAAPRNGVAWSLTWFAILGSSDELLGQLLAGEGLDAPTLAMRTPASLDVPWALALNLSGWSWLWFLALLVYLVTLFPEGRATSGVSRVLAWLATAVAGVGSIVTAIALAPWVDARYDTLGLGSDEFPPAVGIAFQVLLVIVALSLVDLAIRFKRSEGVERSQFKWVASALIVFGLSIVLSIPLYAVGIELPDIVSTLALIAVPVSVGVAITKYRLFDIDLVISRTLVFGVLAGFITAIYAVVVVGLGSLVGGSSVWLSVAATGLVAVVFEPVRERVQRWVNRVVYGKRATPYEVLADLTGRLAATESAEGLLGRMATRLLEGTGADRAIVWLAEDAGLRVAASAPEGESRVVASIQEIEGVVVSISHESEVLGALSVEKRRSEELTPTERHLIDDLAGSAGLVVRRLRLDQALERKADELEESRRRLVDAQDVERRRLERELHDGAQQRVVALKVKLGVAAQMAADEGTDRAATLIGQMADDAQSAIEQIRSLALGIYPPLLESDGLAVAIPAVASLSPLDVVVEVDVSDRYPRPVEGAVYFCVSEALANAAKHAEGPIRVSLSDGQGRLRFEIVDSGPGFDPDAVRRGAGLVNMSDRLDALDGTLTIESAPGRHTTVTGVLPATVRV